MLRTGTKLRDLATGEIWTVMPDQGHLSPAHDGTGERTGQSYRIKNDVTGEERLVGEKAETRFEVVS